jgi:hypothetical protein
MTVTNTAYTESDRNATKLSPNLNTTTRFVQQQVRVEHDPTWAVQVTGD